MEIWLYVAIVIAPLLVAGWIVDRRSQRVRHGLTRLHPARGGEDGVGRVERAAPGTTTQAGGAGGTGYHGTH